MTARLVLVVNHWGGVPWCLHENVLSSQRDWARTALQGLLLSHTDPVQQFSSLLRDGNASLLHGVRRLGYRTAVLGATGLQRRYGRDHDPRLALADAWGIDRCSLHDGASFEGACFAHDEEVLHEADRLMKTASVEDERILLFVNLLSCRSVACLSRDVEERVDRDDRAVPPTLACELANAIPAERVSAQEYQDALARARCALRALDLLVSQLVVAALGAGGCAALTATHSLSLGEHGIRGGGNPTGICCSTLFCSSEALPDPDARPSTLHETLSAFLQRTCGVSCTPSRAWCTLVDAGRLQFARTLVRLRGRLYACITSRPSSSPREDDDACRLLHVFALDEDPGEERDVVAGTAHLAERLDALVRHAVSEACGLPVEVRRAAPPPSVVPPSVPSPPPSVPSPPAASEEWRSRSSAPVAQPRSPPPPPPPPSRTSSRQNPPPPLVLPPPSPPASLASPASSSVTPRRRARREPSSSVRVLETQLNNRHR